MRKTAPKTGVWLGETSSSWGGGAKELSDRYAAGFMYVETKQFLTSELRHTTPKPDYNIENILWQEYMVEFDNISIIFAFQVVALEVKVIVTI